jgi:hypothetical protein
MQGECLALLVADAERLFRRMNAQLVDYQHSVALLLKYSGLTGILFSCREF